MANYNCEVKLDADAYIELCESFFELAEATEDYPWLDDKVESMRRSLQEIKIHGDYTPNQSKR